MDELRRLRRSTPNLAALMITYHHMVSTKMVFVRFVIPPRSGGQVYMDGANMSAQVGLASRDTADVCTNLQEFCIRTVAVAQVWDRSVSRRTWRRSCRTTRLRRTLVPCRLVATSPLVLSPQLIHSSLSYHLIRVHQYDGRSRLTRLKEPS